MYDVCLDGDTTTRTTETNNPSALEIAIADECHTWMDNNISSSTDQCLVMMILHVKLMEMCRLFRLSIQARDVMMIK